MSRTIRFVMAGLAALVCLAPLAAQPRGGRLGDARPTPSRDVVYDARHADAWQALRGIVQRDGGLDADLWPTIGESPLDTEQRWVVWSRFNGSEYDLAYTRWVDRAWMPARWVEGGSTIDPTSTAGDDLDPALDFDRAGRPIVAWWREEGGRGRVYLSLYLASRFLEPIAISRPAQDASMPDVEAIGSDTVRVSFDTPEGRVRHTLRFMPPVTITDDLNPLDFRFRTDLIEVLKQQN